jgi:hypothetical protein
MTKQKFLDRARDQHGYKYKYIDLSDKITLKDYINIEHDSIIYTQRVNKHLLGKCPEKNTPKKTTQDFINESKLVWGDRFDYTYTVYDGALNRVKLYDKYNNQFIEQIAVLHLSGSEVKSMNESDFIEKSKIISDFRYDYTKTNYINKTTKVLINCPTHGDFEVLPFNHINYGEVCKKCLFTKFIKKVKKFCSENDISVNIQHKFDDFNIPFDFYIYPLRIIIDFTYDDLDQVKLNDKIKNDYCEDNYINLIRIRYDQLDNINKILYEYLINNNIYK